MQEACFCGRTGEIEDRQPVATEDGGQALRCPECGHLDGLEWLSDDVRVHVFEEAGRRMLDRQPLTA